MDGNWDEILKGWWGPLRGLLLWAGRWLPGRVRANLADWLRRAANEPDFELFSLLGDERCLLLDIGANRGHAAIAALARAPRLRVLSLEPNPSLRWALFTVALLHPFRFRFRLLGASDLDGAASLLVPEGSADLTAQASLDPHEFDKPYVQVRLASDGHAAGRFRPVPVQLARVDTLDLGPDVVKIDVEGVEDQVLTGMAGTLERCLPALIIEINNSPRWAPFLEAKGYRFYTLRTERGRVDEPLELHHQPDWRQLPGLNVVCLHPASPSPASRQWQRQVVHSP